MVQKADKPIFRLMFGEIDVDVAIGLSLDDPGLWETAYVTSNQGEVQFLLKMHTQYINRDHPCFIRAEKIEGHEKMSFAWFNCPEIYKEAFQEFIPKENNQ